MLILLYFLLLHRFILYLFLLFFVLGLLTCESFVWSWDLAWIQVSCGYSANNCTSRASLVSSFKTRIVAIVSCGSGGCNCDYLCIFASRREDWWNFDDRLLLLPLLHLLRLYYLNNMINHLVVILLQVFLMLHNRSASLKLWEMETRRMLLEVCLMLDQFFFFLLSKSFFEKFLLVETGTVSGTWSSF